MRNQYYLIAMIILLNSGCANKISIVEKEVLPPQPVSFVQDVTKRNIYTKSPNYVMCFGVDCDGPTPKHLKVAPQPVSKLNEASVHKVTALDKIKHRKEIRQRDSIEFIYNTTNINKYSVSNLDSVIGSAKSANFISIVGYAGLTEPNAEHENRVLGLALARGRLIEKSIKESGLSAEINVSAKLVKCKNEEQCLGLYKYGGRRADIEIVTTDIGE